MKSDTGLFYSKLSLNISSTQIVGKIKDEMVKVKLGKCWPEV